MRTSLVRWAIASACAAVLLGAGSPCAGAKAAASVEEEWLTVAITREPVASTHLASVGYDRGFRVLEIEFVSGEIYRYRDVPREIFEELVAAESKGGYFAQRIRGHYPFHCVRRRTR